jgi:hypothetical protein
MVKVMRPNARAALACYCLRFRFLRSIGLAIAEECERRDLICQGGSASGTSFSKTPRVDAERRFQKKTAPIKARVMGVLKWRIPAAVETKKYGGGAREQSTLNAEISQITFL